MRAPERIAAKEAARPLCETCGKKIIRAASKRRSPRFCSYACSGISIRLKPKPCAWCGQLFQAKRTAKKFCSPECRNDSASKPSVTPGIARWRDAAYIREYQAAYRARHKDELREKQKARESTPERKARARETKAAWSITHPEKVRKVAGARLSRLAARPKATRQQVAAMLAKGRGLCVYCGRAARIETDHFDPVARGGGSNIKNLVPVCGPCNRNKSAKDPLEWLEATHGAIGLARAYIFMARKSIDLAFYEGGSAYVS